MIETTPTIQFFGDAALAGLCLMAVIGAAKYGKVAACDFWAWLFDFVTRIHWRLHRRFYPEDYFDGCFVGIDLGRDGDFTAITVIRKNRSGSFELVSCEIIPPKK